jgi:hypothetical protein
MNTEPLCDIINYLKTEGRYLSCISDIIYVNFDEDLSRVISYGVEFKEFIQALSVRPYNILVLVGHFGSAHDFTTNCEYCISEDIDEFLEEDVYNYGNFAWVDFESIEGLKLLEPQEVAELFYLGKMWKPVNGTRFEKLNNRFVYTAHDDGWVNHTYYNHLSDYKELLGSVIVSKVLRIYNLVLNKIDHEILQQLCDLSKEGLAIDILRLSIEEDNTVVIPLYQLGKYYDTSLTLMHLLPALSKDSFILILLVLVQPLLFSIIVTYQRKKK